MLARLRMPHSAVRSALLRLDDQQLSVDNLSSLKHFCPTQDEVSILLDSSSRGAALILTCLQIDALRSFEGDVTTLTAADQFFNEVKISASYSG